MLLVECVFQEFCTLLEHKLIQLRQIGRIVSDGVFHEENRLHTYFQDVVIGIGEVLEQLDDGDNEFRVAVPAENIIHA